MTGVGPPSFLMSQGMANNRKTNKYRHKFGINSGRKSLKAITLAVKEKTALGQRVHKAVRQSQ